MYPNVNCHDESYGLVYLYLGDDKIEAWYMMDWADFNFFSFDALEPGNYTMTVEVFWDKKYGDNDIKDFTVRAYSDKIVKISEGDLESTYNYVF